MQIARQVNALRAESLADLERCRNLVEGRNREGAEKLLSVLRLKYRKVWRERERARDREGGREGGRERARKRARKREREKEREREKKRESIVCIYIVYIYAITHRKQTRPSHPSVV
jgi:hypothetical protein